MRDYLSLVWRRAASVVPQPMAIRALMLKHRAYSFVVAAVFLVALTSTLVFVRNMAIASSQTGGNLFHAADKTEVSNTSTTQTPEGETAVSTTNQNTASGDTSQSNTQSDTSTNVTVNNQQIPVPENGSVTKTIQNDNGSTTVTVNSNNVSNGDVNSGSTTSTSLNVNTSTHSGSTKVEVNRSVTH